MSKGSVMRKRSIVSMLRFKKSVVTADTMAEIYAVTTRTIHRDMNDLKAIHPEIKAEGGVGYMWRDRK